MITFNGMLNAVVVNVVNKYVNYKQMFTVYQIWEEAEYTSKTRISYDQVRQTVESLINDYNSQIPGWTRSIGYHLNGLSSKAGKVGEPPQIYHPVSADVTQYDMNFRFYKQAPAPSPVMVAVTTVKKNQKKVAVSKSSGLFKFNVWVNGELVPCSFKQVRGSKGLFVQNKDYEAVGVLEDGRQVVVKQDREGKLYTIS